MSDRNTFSAGLGAKIVGAIADADGTPAEANLLAEKPEVVRGLLAVLRGTAEIVMKEVEAIRVTLLDFIGTIKVTATKSKFVAKDNFVLDTSDKAEVKISYLGDNFKAWFLAGVGKIEDPISKQILRYGKLRKSATDMPRKPGEAAIIPELGGETKVETTLSEMFSLIRKQPDGKEGVLLNNGWANILDIRDQNGVLRAVSVYWRDDGWDVDADSVEHSFEWLAGRQVFSRKP